MASHKNDDAGMFEYLIEYLTGRYQGDPGAYNERFADVAADRLLNQYVSTLDKVTFKDYRREILRSFRRLSDDLRDSLINENGDLELRY